MSLTNKKEVEIGVMIETEKDPEFVYVILHAAMKGLENYRKQITKKNAYIDMIVRNLKPEYYDELKKYVIPEVFESLGLQDAISIIEKERKE